MKENIGKIIILNIIIILFITFLFVIFIITKPEKNTKKFQEIISKDNTLLVTKEYYKSDYKGYYFDNNKNTYAYCIGTEDITKNNKKICEYGTYSIKNSKLTLNKTNEIIAKDGYLKHRNYGYTPKCKTSKCIDENYNNVELINYKLQVNKVKKTTIYEINNIEKDNTIVFKNNKKLYEYNYVSDSYLDIMKALTNNDINSFYKKYNSYFSYRNVDIYNNTKTNKKY